MATLAVKRGPEGLVAVDQIVEGGTQSRCVECPRYATHHRAVQVAVRTLVFVQEPEQPLTDRCLDLAPPHMHFPPGAATPTNLSTRPSRIPKRPSKTSTRRPATAGPSVKRRARNVPRSGSID